MKYGLWECHALQGRRLQYIARRNFNNLECPNKVLLLSLLRFIKNSRNDLCKCCWNEEDSITSFMRMSVFIIYNFHNLECPNDVLLKSIIDCNAFQIHIFLTSIYLLINLLKFAKVLITPSKNLSKCTHLKRSFLLT